MSEVEILLSKYVGFPKHELIAMGLISFDEETEHE